MLNNTSTQNKPTVSTANLWLLIATIFWSATFPIIKNALQYTQAYTFVWLRFLFAALLLTPIFIYYRHQHDNTVLKHGIILGLLNSAAYLYQTLSLNLISSTRCAFITGCSVILVPILSWLCRLSKLPSLDIVCALLCLLGLYILTGANLNQLSKGDLYVLFSAILYAIIIVYIQHATEKAINHWLLCFYQILFTIPGALAMAIWHQASLPIIRHELVWALCYCVIFATIIPLVLQAKFQKFTSAAKAALIFSLEPVFASLFAWLINNETWHKNILYGGSIMLLSLILPAIWQLIQNSK